jgi:hypothetical protein
MDTAGNCIEMCIILMPKSDEAEQIQDYTYSLYNDIQEIGVEKISLSRKEVYATGEKSIDPITLGTILLTISPLVLTSLLQLIHDWSLRHKDQTIKISYKNRKGEELKIELPVDMSKQDSQDCVDLVIGALEQKNKK